MRGAGALTRAAARETLRAPSALLITAASGLGVPLVVWIIDAASRADGAVVRSGLPAVLSVLCVAVPFSTLAESVVAARERGLLRTLRTVPAPRGGLLIAHAPVPLGLIGAVIALGLAVARPAPTDLPAIVLVVVAMATLGLAFAALAAARARTPGGVRAIGIVLVSAVLLTGGVLPLERTMPRTAAILQYLPTTVLGDRLAVLLGSPTVQAGGEGGFAADSWVVLAILLVGASALAAALRWCRD